MPAIDMKDLEARMKKSLDSLGKELAGLRAGRASTSMLEPVVVSAYGSMMPMNQVGALGAPEPRLLTVTVWDSGLVMSVEKAIRDANLGLNPQVDGNLVRIPVPQLSEERRAELVKVAAKYGEETKIALRNIRRDGMDALKKEKADGLPEDDFNRESDEVQKLTDKYVAQVDVKIEEKEKDIMTV